MPPTSFEQLVHDSDLIATGRIAGISTSWDGRHRNIWTQYRLAVSEVWKGAQQHDLVISEPGGALDGLEMVVPGAVRYEQGETVTLFLRHFATGEWRTVGWSQGKFEVDAQGRVHPAGTVREKLSRLQARSGDQSADNTARTAESLGHLDGITSAELKSRVQKLLAKAKESR